MDLQQHFIDRNQETAQNWNCFTGHREQLHRLIDGLPAERNSILVLGAGNCNDIDLPRLQKQFARLTLADVDSGAMKAGVARQLEVSQRERIETWSWDVTGVFDLTGSVGHGNRPASEAEIDAIERRLASPPPLDSPGASGGRRFDCVVSACLLSQLIDSVKRVVGESHPRFVPLVLAIRRQHIATLLSLAAPGGSALLVFDFVSSLTSPELPGISENQLGAYAAAQVAGRNFFTGLNPAMVLQAFRDLNPACGYSRPPALTAPWRWNLGPRTYLVAAVDAQLGSGIP